MNDQNFKLNENIDINELADMAHIALTEQEKQQIEKEICDFVAFAACLEGYSETSTEEDQAEITLGELREDVAAPSEDHESITALSKCFEDGLFYVPRAVKSKEANE